MKISELTGTNKENIAQLEDLIFFGQLSQQDKDIASEQLALCKQIEQREQSAQMY